MVLLLQVPKNWSLMQCFYLLQGGYEVMNPARDGARARRLEPHQLLRLFETDVLLWPEKMKKDIQDRSKKSCLIKFLAMVTALLLTAATVARPFYHLPITTLELYVLQAIFCTCVTCICWWDKAFSVDTATVIKSQNSETDNVSEVQYVGLHHNVAIRIHSSLSYLEFSWR